MNVLPAFNLCPVLWEIHIMNYVINIISVFAPSCISQEIKINFYWGVWIWCGRDDHLLEKSKKLLCIKYIGLEFYFSQIFQPKNLISKFKSFTEHNRYLLDYFRVQIICERITQAWILAPGIRQKNWVMSNESCITANIVVGVKLKTNL